MLRASIYEGETEKRILNIHLPWGDGTVFWDAGNSTGYDRISKVATGSEISGTWNHWVFTKDSVAGTMAIYLNGALWIDQSDGTPSRTIGAPTDVTLGSGHGELYFDGSIDDLRLFDTALSASQIESLYQKPALYRNWVAASGLTGSDAATNANPDFDTLPNLAEYALGGNPLGTDVPEIHPDVAMPLDAPTVEYTYRRRIDSEARGLTYIVETTTDLGESRIVDHRRSHRDQHRSLRLGIRTGDSGGFQRKRRIHPT